MMTSNLKFLMAMSLATIFFLGTDARTFAITANSEFQSVESKQENDDFKYGQYVYVTLKDGSQTVAKISGKKNSNKYYVKQIGGSKRGLVHKKYIKKMTKEEIEAHKSSRKKV